MTTYNSILTKLALRSLWTDGNGWPWLNRMEVNPLETIDALIRAGADPHPIAKSICNNYRDLDDELLQVVLKHCPGDELFRDELREIARESFEDYNDDKNKKFDSNFLKTY